MADLVGQPGESSTARQRPLGSGRAGSPWLFPGAYPGAHQGAGYLGTSLNEQLGLQIRPGRGAALCDLVRRTARRGPGRTTRHLSRHRRPVGRARQTRLDRLHRRTGRTTLGTRADITDTGGRSSLRRAVVGTNHPQLGAPVTAPSPGTFADGCYGNLHRKFGGHLRRGPTSPPKVRLTALTGPPGSQRFSWRPTARSRGGWLRAGHRPRGRSR